MRWASTNDAKVSLHHRLIVNTEALDPVSHTQLNRNSWDTVFIAETETAGAPYSYDTLEIEAINEQRTNRTEEL